jgi:DNA-binding response OmpR family regulator
MTGYSVDHLIDEARMEGIFAAIKKPFDIREIISFLETQVPLPSNKEMSILVVDDEPDILDFFKRILARKNYTVTCVDGCQRALQEIASASFDLIFLDILLKDGNGIELCQKILKENPSLKVVFITGCSEKIRDEIKGLDVRACLFKPFEMQDIFSEIEKVSQEKEAGV